MILLEVSVDSLCSGVVVDRQVAAVGGDGQQWTGLGPHQATQLVSQSHLHAAPLVGVGIPQRQC